MNFGNPFLIKFLMILFSLEGSVSENVKIHSYIENQIILPRPRPNSRPKFLIWTKGSTFIAGCTDNKITMSTIQPDKYHLFLNGTLKINRLKKMDAGNYTVQAYDEHGKNLLNELIMLQVDELPLKLNELCSQRILTCEVKSSEETKPRFKLFQDTKEMFVQPVYDNQTWKVTLQLKVFSGKFRCEVDVNSGKNHTEKQITCPVEELPLKLNELCSQRILTCEVKSSEEPKPRFKLFQDTKEMFVQPAYDNVTWKVTLQLKVLSGKFRCEVDVNSGKNHTEKQITCPVEDLPNSVPLFLILIIMGSVVALIFLVLIIYCIRRKKAKRREREAEEYALQIQIENHIQQRKLPEIPVSSGSNPSFQQSRLPPSELQQQVASSKSCPHPKPPRRIKERP